MELQSHMLMYLEMQKYNSLVFKSFKICIKNMHNKSIVPTEKECIKSYLEKEKNYQNELLQALSKTNARRHAEELSNIISIKKSENLQPKAENPK